MRARAFLSRGSDILRASRFQEFLRPRNLIGSVAMDRKQYAAILNSAFVALRFILGNSHPDQGANQAAYGSANTQSCKRSHNRAGSYERPYTRDGQSSNSSQQAESPADSAARCNTRRGAFGGLGVLLVRKLLRALSVGKQHRDVVVRKPRRENTIDGLFRLRGVFINAENGCIFSCHMIVLLISIIA